jgi:hypothetical protein
MFYRNALIWEQIYCVWFDVIIVLKSYATAKAILLVIPFAWPFPTIKQISHSRVLILRTMLLKAKVVRVHATNLSLYKYMYSKHGVENSSTKPHLKKSRDKFLSTTKGGQIWGFVCVGQRPVLMCVCKNHVSRHISN